MNLLYCLRDNDFSSDKNLKASPLRAWMFRHARSSINKFNILENSDFHNNPLTFKAEGPNKEFLAYIDPDDRFNITDKLSQVRK